jgi:PAS domain S-box-containing protein
VNPFNEHYRQLFDESIDAAWIQDADGKIIAVNKAYESLTGFPREELLSKNIEEFTSRCRPVSNRELGIVSSETSENGLRSKEHILRKDGILRTVEVSATPLLFDDKQQVFFKVARDVTEENSMTELLAQITNSSPIPTFMIDRDHRITYWNTALESVSGLRAANMLGTKDQWRAFYKKERPTLADLIIDKADDADINTYYRTKYKKSGLTEGALRS